MAVPTLQAGVLKLLMAKEQDLKPVVQCIGIKQVTQQNAQPNTPVRFRLAVSDGAGWCSGMLATQLGEYVTSSRIVEGTYLRLTELVVNELQGRRVLIILMVDLLGHGPNAGNPVPIDVRIPNGGPSPVGNGPSNPPTNPAQPQQQANGNQYRPPTQNGGYGAPPASTGGYGAPAANTGSYGAPAANIGGYGGPAANTGGYGQGGGGYAGSGSNHGAPGGMKNDYGSNGGAYGAPQSAMGNYGMGGSGYGRGSAGAYGAYNAPTPNYKAGSAPIARDEAPPRIIPIRTLNAYQARWTLKARVAQKSDLRRYSNARGEGRFFSFDLIDAGGGEIRCTAFNETCDKFFEQVEEGKVYTLTKASVRPKRPGSNYNQTRHDHEIMLETQTQIQEAPDDAPDEPAIPRMLYNFKRIEEVENTPPKTIIDVVGVVESVDAWNTISKKDGTDTTKRALVIRDDSNRSVEVSLWGEYAMNPGETLEQMYKENRHPILAIKGARVGDFNGRTLSTVSSSNVTIDPDIEEAGKLRHWYDTGGGAQQTAAPLTDPNRSGGSRSDRRVFIDTIREENLGGTGQHMFVQINACVTFIRSEGMSYPACTLQAPNGRQCNKKLQEHGENVWYCERCQSNSAAEWRYILSAQVSDHTGQHWLTAFQESAPDIMGGISAGDLRALDPQAFDMHIFQCCFSSRILKLRIAEETYNDETRIKVTVTRAEALDYVKESRLLLDYIGCLSRNEPLTSAAPTPLGLPAPATFGGYGGGAGQYGAGAGFSAGQSGYHTPTRAPGPGFAGGNTYGNGYGGGGGGGGVGGYNSHGAYGGGGF